MRTKRLFFLFGAIVLSNIINAEYNLSFREFFLNANGLELNALITNASCYGACDGNIDLLVSGGQPPYSFNWSSGNLSEDLGNACSDIYSVTVSDANGCVVDSSFIILEPALLGLLAFGTDVSCFGLCDGSIDLENLPGSPFAFFMWDSPVDVSALCTGDYMVTAVDQSGCQIVISFSINSPEQLILNVVEIIDETNGESNGSIEVSASGGVSPYSFSINSSAFMVSNLFAGISSGTHVICVQDGNGCITCEEIVINNLTATDELLTKFSFFPNPASSYLYLESDQCLSIDILSIQGSILKHFEKSLTHQIDLENFVPGFYVARISDGIGIAYRKVVVE